MILRPHALNEKTDRFRSRLIYLIHGPLTLLDCSFCHPSQPHTYSLYSLPRDVLLPHLMHLVVVGIATSAAITSPLTFTSRMRFVVPSLVLLGLDLYLNTLFTPYPTLINPQRPSPISLFALLRVLRPLGICVLDVLFALYLWTTTTGRFVLFPFPAIQMLQATQVSSSSKLKPRSSSETAV